MPVELAAEACEERTIRMNRILFEKNEVVDGRAVFSDARAEHVLNVLHGTVGQTLKTGVLDALAGTSVIEEIRNLHEREPGSAQRGNGLLSGEIAVRPSFSAISRCARIGSRRTAIFLYTLTTFSIPRPK